MEKHVFLSYVRENSILIDRLKHDLEANNIAVWMDRNDIVPGVRWRAAIRNAIKAGQFFIACFSPEYNNRDKTWMNEELTLAIEELRLRPVDRAWFIPVKLSPCKIPDREIGGGEMLDAFQYVELYPDWNAGIKRLAAAVLGKSSSGSGNSSSQSRAHTAQTGVAINKAFVSGDTNIESSNATAPLHVSIGTLNTKDLNINKKK